MRGFARRFRAVKTTREWLRELRQGEDDDVSAEGDVSGEGDPE
jgi:hypothetical protein